MPRWRPDGFERLEAAAFELFDEQGFDRTTVAEIAQRAGLTQRTFFNHFGDKREVLFALNAQFEQEMLRAIAACADDVAPLDAVVRGLEAADETMFERRRAAALQRHRIVNANPELQERELRKYAALTEAVATALRARGLDPDTAALAAGAGMLVQQAAISRWTRPDESLPLRKLLSEAHQLLRATVNQM